MYSYECEYCGDPLCPELCPEARIVQKKWLESKEFKKLEEEEM